MKMDKRALSEVVSYVFLIIIAIGLSIFVFIFLQKQIPEKKPECPDGLAIIIKEIKCGENEGEVYINFQNKGRFDIDGIYSRYSNDKNQVTDKPLVPVGNLNYISEEQASNGFLYFGTGTSPVALRPNINYSQIFSFNNSGNNRLEKIQIQPFLGRDTNEVIICEDKAVTYLISCS